MFTASPDRRDTTVAPVAAQRPDAADIGAAYAAMKTEREFGSSTQPYGFVKALTLGNDQTLGEAVTRAGVRPAQAFAALAKLDDVFDVRAAKSGQKMVLHLASNTENADATLQALFLRQAFDRIALVQRSASGRYSAESLHLPTQTSTHVAARDIEASLYVSADEAGMPPATIVSLIRALSFRVDFQREIRPGDSFKAIYQTHVAADGAQRAGDIEYAELDLGDRVEKLYQFKHPKTGRIDFFDENGESMRRLLMRTPIDGARLTSGFGRRRHPVLGFVKSHKGVDFGAPTGTPIYAAGDGVIERANRFGSYGNYVKILHARGFKTAYAHLSQFGRNIRSGKRVEQGQIIGYVGATGRVTGPHLHYEIYRGKNRVNPMRLDLPTGEVLSGDVLTAFRAHMVQIDARLSGEIAAR